jgi:hypothetical protein
MDFLSTKISWFSGREVSLAGEIVTTDKLHDKLK